MSIAQVSVSYSKAEDRLLLRMNTRQDREFRLWLTRLLAGQLISQLHQALTEATGNAHSPELARTLSEFRQSATEQSARFTEFKPARLLPLGSTPLLVSGYGIERLPEQFALTFQLQGAKQLEMKISEAIVRQILLLLERMQAHADWRLDPLSPPRAGATGHEPTATQDAASASTPSAGVTLH
jgi:hypothetical protein